MNVQAMYRSYLQFVQQGRSAVLAWSATHIMRTQPVESSNNHSANSSSWTKQTLSSWQEEQHCLLLALRFSVAFTALNRGSHIALRRTYRLCWLQASFIPKYQFFLYMSFFFDAFLIALSSILPRRIFVCDFSCIAITYVLSIIIIPDVR